MRHIKAEPLRSDSELLGLSTLSERERVRVQLANATYALTLLLVEILIRRGCIVSVENPSSSYFWPIMALYVSQCCGILLSWHKLESVHFQACMHGSDRDKWTCWYGTPNVFNSLALSCDGQHQHAQWRPSLQNGVVSFPTAQEASYPRTLCKRVAQCIVEACRLRGSVFPSDAFKPQQRLDETKIPGKRGVKTLPPLVSEYSLITDVHPTNADFKVIDALPTSIEKWGNSTNNRGTKVDVQNKSANKFFGVYRSPSQFVDAALEARHPIDYAFPLPDNLIKAVKRVLEEGPALTNARRKLNLEKVQRQALALRNDERKLHDSLPTQLGRVLEGKNLLLWKQLMEQTGFQDECLFEEMVAGFQLVGTAKVSHEFPYAYQPASQTVDELRKKSKGLRAAAIGKCRASERPDLDEVAWKKTLEERDRHWLSGPFTQAEVQQLVGHDELIANRRLPLEQKDKIRLIDDCNASGLNSAYASTNKLQLLNVDALVALVLCAMKRAAEGSRAVVPLSYG